MSFKKFNPTCPCCCFKNLAVICCYDESTPYLAGTQYDTDREAWNSFIDDLKKSTVVMGIIQPMDSAGNYQIKTDVAAYPYDSVGEILHWRLPAVPPNQPRVTAEDIYSAFVDLKGNLNINLLVFCLDNSGSIVVSNYRSELELAKEWIKEDFNVKILDDLSNAGERWLFDAKASAYKRTCG